MSPLWLFTALAGATLEVLIVAALLTRGLTLVYPALFLYCLVDFGSGLFQWAAFLGFVTEPRAVFYWSNEAAIQFLIFALMMSLIHKGLEGFQGRWVIVAGTGAAVLAVSALTSYVLQSAGASTGMTMTGISRNLSFCSAVLNLALWTILLGRRVGGVQILLISAGLGLLSTGKAIGHSLRLMAPGLEGFGNVVVVCTDLLALAVWLYTFQKLHQLAGGRRPAGSL